MSTENARCVRFTAVLVACVLSLWDTGGLAQTNPPPRVRFQRLSPSVTGQLVSREDGRIQLLILLRGQPGWFLGEPIPVQGVGVAPGTATGPGLSVDLVDGRLVIQGIPHDLGPGNLVLVDDMDFTGKRATVSTRAAAFEGLDGNAKWLDIIRRSREAAAFLRCGESIPPRPRNDVPPQVNETVAAATTRSLNSYVCDDLVRLGVAAK